MPTFQPHDFLFADRQLEQRLINYFVSQGRADLCVLKIRARGGRVRLRGQLASAADRAYVLQGARRVAGVIDVEDAIEVREVTQPRETAQPALVVPGGPAPLLAGQVAAARLIA